MSRSIVALAVLTALAAPSRSEASEIYNLCGPESTGWIRTGRQIACVGGSLDWRRKGVRASSAAPTSRPSKASGSQGNVSAGSNKNIDNELNEADIQFRDGERELACKWVSNAIQSATTNYGGSPSANQKQQLKDYASRCNLRY